MNDKTNAPAEWAEHEFCKRANLKHSEVFNCARETTALRFAVRAGARLIEQHEEPPVDPLQSAVEEALDWWDNHTSQPDPVGHVVRILRNHGIELAKETRHD